MTQPDQPALRSKIIGYIILDPDNETIWRISAKAAHDLRFAERGLPQWPLRSVRLATVSADPIPMKNGRTGQYLRIEGDVLRLDAAGFWADTDRAALQEADMRVAFRPNTAAVRRIQSNEARFARRRIAGSRFDIDHTSGVIFRRLFDHFIMGEPDPLIKRGLRLSPRAN